VGELIADVAVIKDTLFGKGPEMPGVVKNVNDIKILIAKMQGTWDGFIGFAKLIGCSVGFAVVVCELIRAVEPFVHH
jgi:hypothetical protein